jgi:hypothetical protein
MHDHARNGLHLGTAHPNECCPQIRGRDEPRVRLQGVGGILGEIGDVGDCTRDLRKCGVSEREGRLVLRREDAVQAARSLSATKAQNGRRKAQLSEVAGQRKRTLTANWEPARYFSAVRNAANRV